MKRKTDTTMLAAILGLGMSETAMTYAGMLRERIQPPSQSTADRIRNIDAANAKRARKNAKRNRSK